MRDETDFNAIPQNQADTDESLKEWARWCGTGRGGNRPLPMFRGYTPYLYPDITGAAQPVDVLLARKVQRAFVLLPGKHREVLSWAYCYPHVHPGKVQRHLAVTRAGLLSLLVDARAMIGNNLRKFNPAHAVSPACAGRAD